MTQQVQTRVGVTREQLDNARDYAREISECVTRIDFVFELGKQGVWDDESVKQFIDDQKEAIIKLYDGLSGQLDIWDTEANYLF